MHAQLRLAQLHTAQQRSAAPCGAVRCGAVSFARRCGAVSCCALISFEHSAVPGIISVVVYSVACSSFDLSRSPCLFSHENFTRTYCRSDRDTANKHTSQHRVICSAQAELLALPIRCSHPIMGLLFLPPSIVLVAFFLARA